MNSLKTFEEFDFSKSNSLEKKVEIPYELIGTTAVLIDRKNALCFFGSYKDTANKIGWEIKIKNLVIINNEIYIRDSYGFHYRLKNFKVKNINRVFSERDPYGEEEWDEN